MRYKKTIEIIFFIFLGILFLYKNLFANEVIEYFKCPEHNDALTCKNACEKVGYIRITINSDGIKEKRILITSYVKARKQEVKLRNCQITDPKNWLCQDLVESSDSYSFSGYKIFQMIDGQFSQQNNFISEITRYRWVENFFCTKTESNTNEN